MTTPNKNTWYQNWFNTEYYHLLYRDRDDQEARLFIDNLLHSLHLEPWSKVLDLACGRGRHARYLNTKQLSVVGLDLAEQNISFAKQFENEHLHFEQADMREAFGSERFDLVLNLFTSFGYFDDRADNIKACHQIARALKPNGLLLMDFMNVQRVIEGLVPAENRVVEGINFELNRRIEGNKVIKSIDFQDQGQDFHFEERVQLLALADFEEFFQLAGLVIEATFGDYKMGPFDEHQSERLILKARKC